MISNKLSDFIHKPLVYHLSFADKIAIHGKAEPKKITLMRSGCQVAKSVKWEMNLLHQLNNYTVKCVHL